MTIEQSHGKARPTLPRSSDLTPVPDAAEERRHQRDAGGRFKTGNVVGRGRGWKRAIAKMLGRQIDDPLAQAVADDAWRTFSAMMRELPSDGAMVRTLVAAKARHDALAAFWGAKAASLGLATPEGVRAQEQSTKHDQRAERLTVTALDVATRLAKDARTRTPELPPWIVASTSVPEPTPDTVAMSEPTTEAELEAEPTAPATPSVAEDESALSPELATLRAFVAEHEGT